MKITKKAYKEYLDVIRWNNVRAKESAITMGYDPILTPPLSFKEWKKKKEDVEQFWGNAKLRITI